MVDLPNEMIYLLLAVLAYLWYVNNQQGSSVDIPESGEDVNFTNPDLPTEEIVRKYKRGITLNSDVTEKVNLNNLSMENIGLIIGIVLVGYFSTGSEAVVGVTNRFFGSSNESNENVWYAAYVLLFGAFGYLMIRFLKRVEERNEAVSSRNQTPFVPNDPTVPSFQLQETVDQTPILEEVELNKNTFSTPGCIRMQSGAVHDPETGITKTNFKIYGIEQRDSNPATNRWIPI